MSGNTEIVNEPDTVNEFKLEPTDTDEGNVRKKVIDPLNTDQGSKGSGYIVKMK